MLMFDNFAMSWYSYECCVELNMFLVMGWIGIE